jgi:hypothetical protein
MEKVTGCRNRHDKERNGSSPVDFRAFSHDSIDKEGQEAPGRTADDVPVVYDIIRGLLPYMTKWFVVCCVPQFQQQ